MKNLSFILSLFITFSCLSPENIEDFEDEDMAKVVSLINAQADMIIGKNLKKELILSESSTQKEFVIDSNFFNRDFEIIKGKELSLVFQPSSYEKKVLNTSIEYKRKKNEKIGPKILRVSLSLSNQIQRLYIEEVSENMLFTSRKTSSFNFDKNLMLSSYSIESFQKLIGMDESRQHIKGIIQ